MRVTFVTQTPEFGGAEKHLIDFVRRIDRAVSCTILCFSEDFYSQALGDLPNVRVAKLPLIRRWALLSFWRVFRRTPAESIVLVKGIFDHYPLAAYVAARLSGCRRLIALEHLIADPLPQPDHEGGLSAIVRRWIGWRTRYRMARMLQGRLTHLTVCVSEAIRRRLVQDYGYPPASTVTIRNGIDLRQFAVPAAQSAGKAQSPPHVTIVCAARLSRVKRIDILLEALALLKRSHSGWKCMILGTGPLQGELLEQVQRLSLDPWVSFEGQVQDVRPYLQRSDLFVLSSEKEGLPLALLEAMAAGIPAVVTDVGGTGEVVAHGQHGLLVKPGSVEDLERAIAYLLVHHDERRRMGEAARLHVEKHFDIDVSMNELLRAVLTA